VLVNRATGYSADEGAGGAECRALAPSFGLGRQVRVSHHISPYRYIYIYVSIYMYSICVRGAAGLSTAIWHLSLAWEDRCAVLYLYMLVSGEYISYMCMCVYIDIDI